MWLVCFSASVFLPVAFLVCFCFVQIILSIVMSAAISGRCNTGTDTATTTTAGTHTYICIYTHTNAAASATLADDLGDWIQLCPSDDCYHPSRDHCCRNRGREHHVLVGNVQDWRFVRKVFDLEFWTFFQLTHLLDLSEKALLNTNNLPLKAVWARPRYMPATKQYTNNCRSTCCFANCVLDCNFVSTAPAFHKVVRTHARFFTSALERLCCSISLSFSPISRYTCSDHTWTNEQTPSFKKDTNETK